MSDLVIEVLGPVRVFVGDEELAIGGPVDRGVIGMLALRGGQRVAVRDILDAIYPGVPHSSAKRSLQSAVWRLRRALGDHAEVLVTESDGYRLDRDAADLPNLQRAVADARLDVNRGDAERAEKLLVDAIDRWRGRSPEMPRSVTGPADALIADAVHLVAEILLAQGRPEDARVHLERLLDDQPDLETANSLLRSIISPGERGSPARTLAGIDPIQAMAVVLGRATIGELRAALAIWFEMAAGDDAPGAVPDGAAVVEALAAGAEAGVLTIEGEPVARVSTPEPDAAAEALRHLPTPMLLAMHHAAAMGIQRLHGSKAGPHLLAVSEHLLAATPVVGAEVAVDALLAAASSTGTADPAAAVALLERAADTLESWLPDDIDRHLAVLQAIGAAHDARGQPEDANRAWERAIEIAETHQRPTALAHAALALSGSMYRPREYSRTGEMLERALSALPPDDRVRSLVILRRVQLERFRPGSAPVARINTATNRLILAGMSQEDIAAQATVTLSRWVAAVEEGTATFDDDNDLATMVEAAGDVPNLQILWERWAITRATLQGRFGDATAAIAALAPRIRQWAAAAGTTIERDEFAISRFVSTTQLATIRAAQGRHDEARALIEAEIGQVSHGEGRNPIVDRRILPALQKARGGDPDGATELLRAVVPTIEDRPFDKLRYATAIQCAHVAAELGDQTVLDPLLTELDPWRGRHCVFGTTGYGGVTELLLGRLRATRGDLDEADCLLADALVAHLRVRAPVMADMSRRFRADLLQRMGGAPRLAEAEALLADIGQERLPDRTG